MKHAPIPEDEERRISRLRGLCILDTPAEERFDRFTRMAVKAFGVKSAIVSLIDTDRQWSKSRVGIGPGDLPRSTSFCGHAILSEESIFVVENAREDERFADNPFVLGPSGFQFYAAAKIPATIGGSALGTFCILDDKPRTFSETDKSFLQDFGDMVGDILLSLDLARVDELTGLLNKRAIETYAEKNVSSAYLSDELLSLVFFDLDNFKEINDNNGHQAGDEALRVFSNFLKRCVRAKDRVGRTGGDEFFAVLPGATCDEAETMVVRLQEWLDKWQHENKSSFQITFSYGVVKFDPVKMQNVGDVLKAADEKMYACKNRRKTDVFK